MFGFSTGRLTPRCWRVLDKFNACRRMGAMRPLGRFWRIPFVAGWLVALILLKSRSEQIDTNTAALMHIEATAAVAVQPATRGLFHSLQEHIDYINQREHISLVWFGVGIAAFVVCYFASAFTTAGIRAPWRLFQSVDDVSDEALWSAQVFASIG